MDNSVYIIKDIQEILDIGRNSAYNLIAKKQFPVKYIGKSIRIPIEPFQKWLNSEQREEV